MGDGDRAVAVGEGAGDHEGHAEPGGGCRAGGSPGRGAPARPRPSDRQARLVRGWGGASRIRGLARARALHPRQALPAQRCHAPCGRRPRDPGPHRAPSARQHAQISAAVVRERCRPLPRRGCHAAGSLWDPAHRAGPDEARTAPSSAHRFPRGPARSGAPPPSRPLRTDGSRRAPTAGPSGRHDDAGGAGPELHGVPGDGRGACQLRGGAPRGAARAAAVPGGRAGPGGGRARPAEPQRLLQLPLLLRQVRRRPGQAAPALPARRLPAAPPAPALARR